MFRSRLTHFLKTLISFFDRALCDVHLYDQTTKKGFRKTSSGTKVEKYIVIDTFFGFLNIAASACNY